MVPSQLWIKAKCRIQIRSSICLILILSTPHDTYLSYFMSQTHDLILPHLYLSSCCSPSESSTFMSSNVIYSDFFWGRPSHQNTSQPTLHRPFYYSDKSPRPSLYSLFCDSLYIISAFYSVPIFVTLSSVPDLSLKFPS